MVEVVDLPQPGLADQADALAAVHGEADAVDGAEDVAASGPARAAPLRLKSLAKPLSRSLRGIFLDQLLDHQQRPAVVAVRLARR